MVMSHHEDIEIWQVTKGLATEDEAGNPIDTGAIWQNVAGYACRIADMANYSEKFFEPVPVPARSDDEEDDEATPSPSPDHPAT